MYTPSSFAETDLAKLHDAVERYSFGMLISTGEADEPPTISHVPFLLDRSAGKWGALTTHVARANGQWKGLEGRRATAAFSGPHAYISPTWYESDKLVPTWNYVAVHAVGRVQLLHDPAELRALLSRLAEVYEQGRPTPWKFDRDDPRFDDLLPQIVGLRIEIESIEGKWKLSQNHPIERRRKVAAALRGEGCEQAAEVARLMEEGLPELGPPAE